MLLLGCTGGDRSASPARSDSLGVSVIEYDNDFGASAGPQRSTDTLPLFTVGSSTPELYRVRTAQFLSDGQFVVANAGSRELLIFDQAGQLVTRAGGEGQGPGEFREIMSLSVGPGDSIFAFDNRQQRLSVFDQRGQFARSVTLRVTADVGSIVHVGVVGSGEVIAAVHSRTSGPGLVRDSLIVTTFDSSGEPERRLGVFPHQYTHWGPHPNPEGAGTIEAAIAVAFSSMAEMATGATSVFVGLPENYALLRVSLEGGQRVTRQRQAPAAITEMHRDRLFTALARAGLVVPQELEILRELRGPTTLPGFGFEPMTALVGEQPLLVTDLDEVWMLAFQLPDDSGPEKWFRLDTEGIYQGTVAMPACFRATDVREDVVLGICRDSNDVEFVHAYRLLDPN
jgi:hypothetical protein